ncbi:MULTISPECIES: hypothetical protein [unclassified Granulicatella]|uniref:hypothetical protein n=1 Tax=unclassified Granulicatella TaxID=2630493 RepID=UPI00107301A6|nr:MULTISPECIES: hypothetical protein [unclassified Granulicatella]MBF0779486.1 hypothetical protein [Granulicatella sp. 19428wC4_WM01]TFU96452.1 hypothetical protein E4T68_00115 [Granulicatella sp. WM01]
MLYENIFEISKTLRFELKPYEKTLHHLERNNILTDDTLKFDKREYMQSLFDDDFKKLIDETLALISLDQDLLTEVFSEDTSIKERASEQLKNYIKSFFDTSSPLFSPDKHLKLLEQSYPTDDTIRLFKGFSTYFKKFFDTRKRIFSEITHGTIAYRLIDENLVIFKKNIDKFNMLPDELKQQLLSIGGHKINALHLYSSYLTSYNIVKYRFYVK